MRFTDVCSSTGERLTGRGDTSFMCPRCAEAPIGRSARARDQSMIYECSNCGFEGP